MVTLINSSNNEALIIGVIVEIHFRFKSVSWMHTWMQCIFPIALSHAPFHFWGHECLTDRAILKHLLQKWCRFTSYEFSLTPHLDLDLVISFQTPFCVTSQNQLTGEARKLSLKVVWVCPVVKTPFSLLFRNSLDSSFAAWFSSYGTHLQQNIFFLNCPP